MKVAALYWEFSLVHKGSGYLAMPVFFLPIAFRAHLHRLSKLGLVTNTCDESAYEGWKLSWVAATAPARPTERRRVARPQQRSWRNSMSWSNGWRGIRRVFWREFWAAPRRPSSVQCSGKKSCIILNCALCRRGQKGDKQRAIFKQVSGTRHQGMLVRREGFYLGTF